MKIPFLTLVVAAACAAPKAHDAPTPPSASPSQLLAAVEAKDAARVDALLRADATLVDARSEKGTPVVLVALFTMKDRESFVRPQENAVLHALLAHRPTLDRFGVAAFGDARAALAEIARDPAYVAARHRIGWTPLHFASFTGNAPVARALLDGGADVNAVADNTFRNTPLQTAMLTAQLEVARILVARKADVGHKQEGGFTALHEAAMLPSRELVTLLLDAGADPRAAADDGRTPIDVARAHGDTEIEALLTRAAARDR